MSPHHREPEDRVRRREPGQPASTRPMPTRPSPTACRTSPACSGRRGRRGHPRVAATGARLGMVRDTLQNLEDALAGETYEVNTM